MKRVPFLLLALLLCWAVVACDTTESATPTEEPAPTEIATDVTEAPTEMPTLEPTNPPTAAPTATAPPPIATLTPTLEATIEPTATVTATEMMTLTDSISVGLELVAEGFTSPVGLVSAPDDSGRLFVVDQVGIIYIVNGAGEVIEESFLDIRFRMVPLSPDYDERGLLGLAFHPDYAENGRFFVYYSAPLREGGPEGWDHTSHISEFTVSADNPDVADPASERVILQVDQPQGNHNGGQIAFGPDGYLYVALGDGGGSNDVDTGHVEDWYDVNEGGNGQDLAQNLLGSILRIDVDSEGAEGQLYGIPEDNPFVDIAGAAEIFAYGFRNPYRMTFDMNGEPGLIVSDAGQVLWEEVSFVQSGGNYGWNVKEGTHCFSSTNPQESLAECPETGPDGQPLIDPIIEFQNANVEGGLGLTIIGGYVYRGSAIPELSGHYVFGQWSASFANGDGSLFVAMPTSGEALWAFQDLPVATTDSGRLDAFLLSFGQDADGELYVLVTDLLGPFGSTGRVYRIVPAPQS